MRNNFDGYCAKHLFSKLTVLGLFAIIKIHIGKQF